MLCFQVNWSAAKLVEQTYAASLDGLCLDVDDYVRTALPVCMWRAKRRVFVHAGLFAEHKLQHVLPQIFRHIEIARPHPNLQERFFTIGEDMLISNVIGATRLVHNLTLLRLLGVKREQVFVIPEQYDFTQEYKETLATLGVDTPIKLAVFGFGGEALVTAWRKHFGQADEVASCSHPLLRAIRMRSAQSSILFVHLTSVYGAQLVRLVDLLHRDFGLEEVVLFGACGAVKPNIGLHDTIFVRAVRNENGGVLAEDNELLPLAAYYPAGLTGRHQSHVADVASVACIPHETRGALERLADAGVSAVDLELGPLAGYLRNASKLCWGAVLHVSDRPLVPRERLGTIQLLADTSETRQAEALNQTMILASRLPRTAPSVRSETHMSWKKAGEAGPFTVWEAILPSREGKSITIHAALIPLDKLALVPAVNPAGQGFVWKDEIVRGMLPWDEEHMIQMNILFRKSPRQFLKEATYPPTFAILNGNGNLFWNLGHFVYLRPMLYHHVRDYLCSRQTMLVQDSAGLRIAVVEVDHLAADVEFAMSGLRILHEGNPVDILAPDPDTGLPAIHDFYGDITHVLHGFRLSMSLSRRLFEVMSQTLHRDGMRCFAKAEALHPFLRDAVSGYPITCRLARDEHTPDVRANLTRFSYAERRWGEPLTPGTFTLHSDGLLALSFRRATLGHSVIASTRDPSLLLLVNTYTDPDRKGFTLENTARVVYTVAESMGHRALEALVLSSSGDPRIVLHQGSDLVCLDRNQHGEPLLFKGGLEYGLSNILMLVEKP